MPITDRIVVPFTAIDVSCGQKSLENFASGGKIEIRSDKNEILSIRQDRTENMNERE